MTSDLVPIDSASDAQAATSRLREMRRWIDDCTDVEQLTSARQSIYEAREWMRIKKLSEALRREALRIECVAIRKIVQIGSRVDLPSHLRTTGEFFAGMTDEEFNRLLDECVYASSPKAFLNHWNGERERRRVQDEAWTLGVTGRPWQEPREEPDGGVGEGWYPDEFNFAMAVKQILLVREMTGDAFSVDEAVEQLHEALDPHLDSELHRDMDFHQALAEVVRSALRAEVAGPAQGMDTPRFVTFCHAEHGWLRIPWASAHLDQLRYMARTRREQASQVAAAADRLDLLVQRLESAAAAHPGTSRVQELADHLSPPVWEPGAEDRRAA